MKDTYSEDLSWSKWVLDYSIEAVKSHDLSRIATAHGYFLTDALAVHCERQDFINYIQSIIDRRA